MRVPCSHCSVVADLDGLRAVDGGFGFICNHCGQINVVAAMVEAPQVAPSPQRPPVPQTAPVEPLPPGMYRCPKCANQQRNATSCDRCGLVFARAAAGTARFSDPLAGCPLADDLRRQWLVLRTTLDDEPAHHAFISLCAQQGALEFAGQCYRRVLSVSGHEDPRVAAYRDRVIKRALTGVDGYERLTAEAQGARHKKILLVVSALLIVGILAAGFIFFSSYRRALGGP